MKFGLRRTIVLTFAPPRRKVRTGPDWEVRTSDNCPDFRAAEEKTSDRIGLGSSDFGQLSGLLPQSEVFKLRTIVLSFEEAGNDLFYKGLAVRSSVYGT